MPLHSDPSTKPPRRRSLFLAVPLVLGVLGTVASPLAPTVGAAQAHAAVASAEDIAGAEALLAETRARREQAESRLADATARKATLQAELEDLREGAARITQDLAEARAEVREYAVAAYIDGGQSAILGAGLNPSERAELAWHTALTASRTVDTADAVDRYEALKASNDPERVAAATRLDEATTLVETAQSDAIQAAAHERDAEVALERLREAAEAQAARRAAQSEAAARQAAAGSAGTSSGGSPPGSSTARTGSGAASASSPAPPAPVASSGARGNPTAAESAQLAKIRHCESRGNYQIVSASGRYRGAYQFDMRTWAGVGGSGDPAAASPAEQDYRALLLLRQRGTRPWPNCG